MSMAYARLSDPHNYGARQTIPVRMDEIHRNEFLRRCTVLQHNPYNEEVIMYEDEVRDARQRDLDEKHYRNMQGRMMGASLQAQVQNQYAMPQQYYYAMGGTVQVSTVGVDTMIDNQSHINKQVADNKAKKHASNLMKCYWAHYNKIKEKTV